MRRDPKSNIPPEVYYADGIVPPKPTLGDRIESSVEWIGRSLTSLGKTVLLLAVVIAILSGLKSLGVELPDTGGF